MPKNEFVVKKIYLYLLILIIIVLTGAILFNYYFFKSQIRSVMEHYDKQKNNSRLIKSAILKIKDSNDSLQNILDSLQLENDRLNLRINVAGMEEYYLVLDVSSHYFYLMKRDMVIYSDIFGSGKGSILVNGRKYDFSTPKKEFNVFKKKTNPWWIRPLWFWTEQKLPIPRKFIEIPSYLPYHRAIQFYNRLSASDKLKVRKVPGALGRYKIILQDGFLIHYGRGLGRNSSHGCIRVSRKSLEILFKYLEVGSAVFVI